MDVKNELENEQFFDVEIKQEPELLIDDDGSWKPTEFQDEENEYYQELFDECNQISIRDESGFEKFSITFLDESNSNNYEDEGSDYDTEEDEYQNTNSDEEVASNKNLKKYGCPECTERFCYYKELRQHIEQNHKERLAETETNYLFGGNNKNCGECKKCNKVFSSASFRYFHAMKHDENESKLLISLCKACNFKCRNSVGVQKHIAKIHPEIIKEFDVSEMWYHFMDKHPHEDKVKMNFNCHLCVCETFNEEDDFLQHLAEQHKLNSWDVLNFRRVIEEREFVACIECGSLFVQSDKFKILKHFLKHDDSSFWTCKFCSKKIGFQNVPLRHICCQLIDYYRRNNDAKSTDNCRIKNLQEFENHIAHVCPFCNKEYIKMLNWQEHLKKIHAIETLKGLEMKRSSTNDKLYCMVCNALVANLPEKLHAHRFQHLPFKPYKCISCSCALSTFKMAVNHIYKRCKDEEDRSFVGNICFRQVNEPVSDIRSFLEIQCALCKNKKFNDTISIFKHYRDEHNNFEEMFTTCSDNSVTCKICHKMVMHTRKHPRYQHIINHCDEKTFQCKLCSQSYSSSSGINYHFLSHPSTKPFFGQTYKKMTEKSVSSEAKTDAATKTITNLAVSNIKSYVLNEFGAFIGFVCPECNEDMGSQPDWQTHIATQHNFFDESKIYFKDVDGSLKCTTCKIKLPKAPTQQQKHKLTHMPYKSFMCKLCYARCNSLGILYGHFRYKHFAKGSFPCPSCPEILQTSYQRTMHLKDKHPRKEWPDTMCLICYSVLSSTSTLRSHMRTHDIDRFKYSCDICGSRICELKDFKLHVERHQKRGEVKDTFRNGMASHSKSVNNQSNNMRSQLSCDFGNVPHNESTTVFPAIKKQKYSSEED